MNIIRKTALYLLSACAAACCAGEQTQDKLLESARIGDAAAQLRLADEFFFGRSRAINPALAAYWYRKAAEQGNAAAQFNLGACHEYGWGTTKSLILAYERYAQAAGQQLVQAAVRQAELLYTGIPDEEDGKRILPGIPADRPRALNLLRRYPDSPAACKSLAKLLLSDRKDRIAHGVEIRSLLEKCNRFPAPDPEAMLLLATVLQDGIGGNYDQKRAADLLEKTAKTGHPEGMFRYGLLLEHGHGIKPDPAAAIALYRQAAEKKSPGGMTQLARHLKSGFFVPADLQKAFQLFKKAADRKYPPAFAEVGDCWCHGIGTAQSEEAAFIWYIRGAELGDPDAQLKAGECYRLGKGITADPAGAIYWYRQAAQQEHPEALRRLGEALLSGYGVKKNQETGIRFLQKAAQLGDREAQQLLTTGGNR